MSGLRKILSRVELSIVALVMALSLIPTVLFTSNAFAARTTNSATLNGGASVTVSPGASIAAVVGATLTEDSHWHLTGWEIASSPPSNFRCENTTDYISNGSFSSESFTITAPVTVGTYNAYFRISGHDSNCNNNTSSTLTLSGAVIVADSVAPTVGAVSVYGDGNHNPYVDGDGSGYAIMADVSDSGSGIRTSSCEYTIDGTNWLAASYDGSNHRCYKSDLTAVDATVLTLNIRVKDNSNNTGTGVAITRTADSANPVSAAVIDSSYYGHNNYYSGFIKGTASDTSGIKSPIQLTIKRSGDNHYWDGSIWNHNQSTVNAIGTTSWSYSGINADKFDNGVVYTVTPAVVEDGVGNRDHGTADSFTWDEAAPTTSYAINPTTPNGDNGWYKGVAPTVTLSTAETGATIYWRWNSESWNSGTSPQHPIVTEGSRTLEYYSKDVANNEETPHTTKTIKYDNTVPSVNAGADKTTNALFTQNATVTGANSYSWTKQSGPGAITFGTATSEDTTVSASADGTYVIRLSATDLAGNSAYDEFTLVWDTLKPITAADAGTYIFGSWTNENVEVTLTASDTDGSGVYETLWCYADIATDCMPGSIYGTTDHLTFDSAGQWKLRYYSTDNAGNIETTQSKEIKIDITKPTVTPSGYGTDACAGIFHNSNYQDDYYGCAGGGVVWYYLQGSDDLSGLSKIYYSFDAINYLEYNPDINNGGGISISGPSRPYTISYYGVDNAGNVSDVQTITGEIDTDYPVITLDDQTSPTKETILHYSGNATDAYSGIDYIEYSVDGGPRQLVTNFNPFTGDFSFDTPVLAQGYHKVRVFAYDNATNDADFTSKSVYVDTTAPVIILNGDNNVSLFVGGVYTEQGATSTEGTVIITGTVNTAVVGTYFIRYNATDAAGNAATQVIRTVSVNSLPAVLGTTLGATFVAGATTPTTTPTPTVTPTVTPTPADENAITETRGTTDQNNDSNLWWLWIIVFLVVAGGLWWFFFLRKRLEDEEK